MTTRVEKIAAEVKALPIEERAEFLDWLADFVFQHSDAWDEELARDALPGGRLAKLMDRARQDIADGRTKPLDEVLRDT